MSLAFAAFDEKPRRRALLDCFACIEDPRDVRRVVRPLSEVLLLAACGAMVDRRVSAPNSGPTPS